MAKEIVWDSLTQEEAQTLENLRKNGIEIYAAPIEIEHKEQLETLSITQQECRTWYIGNEKVIVHLTPADKGTYHFLLDELRTRHRKEHRSRRCQIPGKNKPLIMCPECNRCSECPYPEYRDKHKANSISWDGLIESGYEGEADNCMVEQLQAKLEYDEIHTLMDSENPIIAQVFEMKERDGFSVSEIADRLHIKPRNVYYYLDRAKAIGKKYNKEI